MKALLRSRLSSGWTFFANRPSALERAVRQSPKSRRLRMEPLENRALLAVDAFGVSASLAEPNLEESWGSAPAPAAFSASELSTDAAETTISLAALNAVPYGPYVTSEQAALIALRSNATLAAETLADFGALWDETDETNETTLAETATDAETLSVVAEALAFESLDLGEVEQEPFPGDASVTSGSAGNSGQNGQGDGSGDAAELVFDVSGGIDGSYVMPGTNVGTDAAILEGQTITFMLTPESGNPDEVVVTATLSGLTPGFDYIGNATREITLTNYGGSFTLQTIADSETEGDQLLTITLSVTTGEATFEDSTFTLLIVDKPEFISDVDANETETPINDDVYRSYIKRDAEAGTSITSRTPINAVGSSLRYTLIGTSDFFQINETTGAITLKSTAPALLATHNKTINAHDWELQIKTQDTRFENYSGGGAYSDVATVRIDLSEWSVTRDNLATANATPADGCTIADLAEQVGLTAGEFEYWLTKNDDATYELFDGSTVTGAQLTVNSVLAASSSTSVADFAVPNTIYLTWMGDCGWFGLGKWVMNFDQNKSQLHDLGFKVSVFDNDSDDFDGLLDQWLGNSDEMAKMQFASRLQGLAQTKSLHGLYLMGHGSTDSISSSGWAEGPKWSIYYGSVIDPGQSLDFNKLESISIAGALKYRLGALIIHACNSLADEHGVLSDSRYLVSEGPERIYSGWSGTYVPILNDCQAIGKHWGAKEGEAVIDRQIVEGHYIGGKQESDVFFLPLQDSSEEE